MSHHYRQLAKNKLEKATALLATNINDDLVYAHLELRNCVEAIAYELLTHYLAEVPLSAFEVWQPDKVMRELMEVDPQVEHDARISFQREATATEPAGPWIALGQIRRLETKRLTKIFHQLGAALHVPTIRQSKSGREINYKKMRTSAEKIRAELHHVLSATIFDAHFSETVTFCCTECETPIKRHRLALQKTGQTECGGCGQAFDVEIIDKEYYFVPVKYSWNCEDCGSLRELAQSKTKVGLVVNCSHCNAPSVLSSVTTWRVNRPKNEGD